MRYTPRGIDDLESRRSSATIPPVRVHFRREQAADSWHLREPLPFTDANGVKGEGIGEHRRLLRAGNKLSLPESLGSRSFFTGLSLSAIVAPPVEINDEETRTNTRRRNEPSLPGAALTKARANAGDAVASWLLHASDRLLTISWSVLFVKINMC